MRNEGASLKESAKKVSDILHNRLDRALKQAQRAPFYSLNAETRAKYKTAMRDAAIDASREMLPLSGSSFSKFGYKMRISKKANAFWNIGTSKKSSENKNKQTSNPNSTAYAITNALKNGKFKEVKNLNNVSYLTYYYEIPDIAKERLLLPTILTERLYTTRVSRNKRGYIYKKVRGVIQRNPDGTPMRDPQNRVLTISKSLRQLAGRIMGWTGFKEAYIGNFVEGDRKKFAYKVVMAWRKNQGGGKFGRGQSSAGKSPLMKEAALRFTENETVKEEFIKLFNKKIRK